MDWRTGIQFSAGAMMGLFSLCHHIQTGSGAHPTPYPGSTGGFLPRGKVAGA